MPFKVRFRGFTLVELLVVLVIFLIVGTILFYLLIKALKWVSTTGGEVKQELSTEINTDLLVFDLKHAGYGISKNETKLVIEYPVNATFGEKILALRETINALDTQYTLDDKDYGCGFLIVHNNETIYNDTCGNPYINNAVKCVWLSLERYYKSYNSCKDYPPTSGDYLGFPVDIDSACKGGIYCCQEQECTTIFWFLDTDGELPKRCLNSTYKLSRQAGPNVSNKRPIINCVSDWDVWFGFDTDNDTKVDSWTNNISSYNNTQLKKQLKIVKIFILVQASSTPDPNYDFCQMANVTCTEGSTFISIKTSSGRDIELQHPDNEMWKHYRWKIIEITVTGFPNIP